MFNLLTDPVNVTFLTNSWRHRASLSDGVLSRSVVRTLITPGSNPAFSARWARASVDSGVSGDGLMTMVQPAANAAPHFLRIIATGKFHGTRAAATPIGCLMVKTRRPSCAGSAMVPRTRSASPANHQVKPTEYSSSARASANGFPVSYVMILAISSLFSRMRVSLIAVRSQCTTSSGASYPFEKQLGSLSGVELLVLEERGMSRLDSFIYVFGGVVWSRCPDLAIARIIDVKSLAALRFCPFPVDV
jgi:hypothetical protein